MPAQTDAPVLGDRFSVEKEETLWYYRELVKACRTGAASGFSIEELDRGHDPTGH